MTISEGDTCQVGNYSFTWSKEHIAKEDSDPLRFTYDELSSQVVEQIQAIHRSKAHPPAKLDLLQVVEEHRHENETLARFWNETHTVPSWVDWEQLKRGQKYFYRYALANLVGFAFQGFIGENSASQGVVEVLLRTGSFSNRTLPRRLLETFQFLLEVTHSLEYIMPGGLGHETAMRVRLVHAMVRDRILKVAEKRGGAAYFDTTRYGPPVNNLDAAHSLTTFCCNQFAMQLPLMGITVPGQEREDYVALWRYLGYVLGTPTDHFVSAHDATVLMESLSYNELSLSESSRIVGDNFIQTIKDLPPMNLSAGFVEAASRGLNGDQCCDGLGIGRPGLYSYACFKGLCWFVKSLSLAQRWSPALDQWSIRFHRDMLHKAIIHSKAGLNGRNKLEFKYVPDGTVMGKEKAASLEREPRFYERPVEMFFLGIFVLYSAGMTGLMLAAYHWLRLLFYWIYIHLPNSI